MVRSQCDSCVYTLLDSIRRGQEINVAARNLIKKKENGAKQRAETETKTQQYNGPRMLFMAVNIFSNWRKLCGSWSVGRVR